LQKLALLITPEDKSTKQQNQAVHLFHWQPKLSTDLIFRSQQIWGDKKHVSVQLWLVTSCALSAVKGCQTELFRTTYDGCIGKWSIAHHKARAWADVSQQWVVTS